MAGLLVLTGALLGGPMVPAAGSSAAVACVAPQWATPAVATAAWANVPGASGQEKWLAGDGGWTIVHPTTCNRLHVFGDSSVTNAAGQRVMPHGNAVLQTASGLQLITGAKSMIPDSPDGSIDWPGPVLQEGNRLFSFTSHIKTTDGVVGWEDKGKDLAEFTWTGGTSLPYRGKWVTPSTGRAGQQKQPDGTWRYAIMWGAAAVTIGGWHYVYGTYQEQGWFGSRVYLASVPVGKLTNASAWMFYNGVGFSAKESDAKAVISEYGGPESSFSVGMVHSIPTIISKANGTFGDTVTRWRSTSGIAGPWTTTPLFKAPWLEVDQTYLATGHFDMRYADGTMPVTIAHGRGSSGSLDEMWTNPARYRNSWHAVAP